MIITGKYPNLRMRRSRKEEWSRRLVRENTLSANDFVLPKTLSEGSNQIFLFDLLKDELTSRFS